MLNILTKTLIIFIAFISTTHATEQDERNAIYHLARTAYLSGDYAKLERLAKEYQANNERTLSGVQKLSLLYYGIERGINSQSKFGYKEAKESMQLWGLEFPKSEIMWIAMAQLAIYQSYQYPRPTHVNNLIPDTKSRAYQELSFGYDTLMKYSKRPSSSPNWYVTMTRIAKYNHMEKAAFTKLLNEGLKKFPDHYELYFHAAQYFSPDYYGSKEDLEKFITESVNRTKKAEGNSMYARIYWYLIERNFGEKLFYYTNADWDKMKAGFEDIIKRYPAPWNINNYARIACTIAKDKETTAKLMRQIEADNIPHDGWHTTQQFNNCNHFYSK